MFAHGGGGEGMEEEKRQVSREVCTQNTNVYIVTVGHTPYPSEAYIVGVPY